MLKSSEGLGVFWTPRRPSNTLKHSEDFEIFWSHGLRPSKDCKALRKPGDPKTFRSSGAFRAAEGFDNALKSCDGFEAFRQPRQLLQALKLPRMTKPFEDHDSFREPGRMGDPGRTMHNQGDTGRSSEKLERTMQGEPGRTREKPGRNREKQG